MAHLSSDITDDGVCVVTFDRPPVNAISLEVYEEIGALVDRVEASDDIRVVVLAAPEGSRAWCGGADLHDFQGMTPQRRRERYAFINGVLPRFGALDRPTIAAVNGPTVGVGVILAGLCDLRVASTAATFASPEIDYGLIAGGAGLMDHLNLPLGLVREMVFTGQKVRAERMLSAGFCNAVVEPGELLPTCLDLATRIAAKSLQTLRADKQTLVEMEGLGWQQAYLHAQEVSAGLVASRDSQEGVNAFLERRRAEIRDA